jgi:hypothetical protein
VRTVFAAGLPLGLVALLTAPDVNAQPAVQQPIRLEYLSDERCPRAEDFQAMVLGRTDKTVFVETRARTARVEMHVDGRRAQGSLRMEDFGPTIEPREVTGDTCAEVADALALTLALSIDPHASLRATRRPPVSTEPASTARTNTAVTTTAAQPPAQPVRVVPSSEAATPPSSTTFALGAAMTNLISSLRPMAGAKLFAELNWRTPRSRIALRVQTAALTNLNAGSPVETQLYALGIGSAYLVQHTPFCFGPTARVDAGVLAAAGRGFTTSRDTTSLWAAGSVGFRVDLDLARWATLSAEPAFVLPLARVRFLEERTKVQVAELSGVAAELSLGASITF